MQEVQSKGLIQPLIVVMTGGKSAGKMVDSKFICKVKMEDEVLSAWQYFMFLSLNTQEKCHNTFYAFFF